MNEEILKKYGFEMIIINHWRKNGFGISKHWDGDEPVYLYSGVSNNPKIKTEEQLKEMYKEKTGEELQLK